MSDTWSTNQRKLQEWLALPKYERFPPTQDLLAADLGLNPVTLTRWKQLDGFMAAVADIAEEYLGNDLAEIYGALAREAKKGSFPHIKLALEVTGRYVERSEHDVNARVAVITADELAAARKRAAAFETDLIDDE